MSKDELLKTNYDRKTKRQKEERLEDKMAMNWSQKTLRP